MGDFQYRKSYEFGVSHKAYRPPRPCASKILTRKYDQAVYDAHRERVAKATASLDNGPPKEYMHLQVKLKKIQAEEDRLAEIERDNRILLDKMAKIMRTSGNIDCRNYVEFKSLDREKRQRELVAIARENQAMLHRIQRRQPNIKAAEQEAQFRRHLELQELVTTRPSRESVGSTFNAMDYAATPASDDEEDLETTNHVDNDNNNHSDGNQSEDDIDNQSSTSDHDEHRESMNTASDTEDQPDGAYSDDDKNDDESDGNDENDENKDTDSETHSDNGRDKDDKDVDHSDVDGNDNESDNDAVEKDDDDANHEQDRDDEKQEQSDDGNDEEADGTDMTSTQPLDTVYPIVLGKPDQSEDEPSQEETESPDVPEQTTQE